MGREDLSSVDLVVYRIKSLVDGGRLGRLAIPSLESLLVSFHLARVRCRAEFHDGFNLVGALSTVQEKQLSGTDLQEAGPSVSWGCGILNPWGECSESPQQGCPVPDGHLWEHIKLYKWCAKSWWLIQRKSAKTELRSKAGLNCKLLENFCSRSLECSQEQSSFQERRTPSTTHL